MSDPDFGEELDRMDRNFKRIADERDEYKKALGRERDQNAGLRSALADEEAALAKAQARVAELEAALRGYVEAVIEVVPTTMSKGGVAHSLVLSPDRTELGSRALASDGTSALAAVRLAQMELRHHIHHSGAPVSRPAVALAALNKAFGSGT